MPPSLQRITHQINNFMKQKIRQGVRPQYLPSAFQEHFLRVVTSVLEPSERFSAMEELIKIADEKKLDLMQPITPNGNNIAHFAAYYGDEEVLRLLHESGFDIAIENNMGTTAFDFAFSHLPKPDLMRDDPIYPTESNFPHHHRETLNFLISTRKFDVNSRDKEGGDTCLHAAIRAGNLTTATILVAHGADVNARENCGVMFDDPLLRVPTMNLVAAMLNPVVHGKTPCTTLLVEDILELLRC